MNTLQKPIEVVVNYRGKMYRDEITNYEKLDRSGYSIKLPKYKGNQYYSGMYYQRMTRGRGKWEDLPQLKKD